MTETPNQWDGPRVKLARETANEHYTPPARPTPTRIDPIAEKIIAMIGARIPGAKVRVQEGPGGSPEISLAIDFRIRTVIARPWNYMGDTDELLQFAVRRMVVDPIEKEFARAFLPLLTEREQELVHAKEQADDARERAVRDAVEHSRARAVAEQRLAAHDAAELRTATPEALASLRAGSVVYGGSRQPRTLFRLHGDGQHWICEHGDRYTDAEAAEELGEFEVGA